MSHNIASPAIPNVLNHKRKRRPPGTPDPNAEVVCLSPRSLLEFSDRYVCEICKKGFKREQNLQMHRRRHKVPWKLVRREITEEDGDGKMTNKMKKKKKVYVCPEVSCLHHDPSHALGDLVGIKKHFRRKHSKEKQWVCGKCSKGYAVHSDFKAHIKTCGSTGHSCDCGRVFSRVKNFIGHQNVCKFSQVRLDDLLQLPASSSRSGSSTSNTVSSLEANNISKQPSFQALSMSLSSSDQHHNNNLEVRQPLFCSSNALQPADPNSGDNTHFKLSKGSEKPA